MWRMCDIKKGTSRCEGEQLVHIGMQAFYWIKRPSNTSKKSWCQIQRTNVLSIYHSTFLYLSWLFCMKEALTFSFWLIKKYSCKWQRRERKSGIDNMVCLKVEIRISLAFSNCENFLICVICVFLNSQRFYATWRYVESGAFPTDFYSV